APPKPCPWPRFEHVLSACLGKSLPRTCAGGVGTCFPERHAPLTLRRGAQVGLGRRSLRRDANAIPLIKDIIRRIFSASIAHAPMMSLILPLSKQEAFQRLKNGNLGWTDE